jgi:hypothetical protein
MSVYFSCILHSCLSVSEKAPCPERAIYTSPGHRPRSIPLIFAGTHFGVRWQRRGTSRPQLDAKSGVAVLRSQARFGLCHRTPNQQLPLFAGSEDVSITRATPGLRYGSPFGASRQRQRVELKTPSGFRLSSGSALLFQNRSELRPGCRTGNGPSPRPAYRLSI